MEFNWIKVVILMVLMTHLLVRTAAVELSAADKKKIEKGLETGKAIAEVLKEGKFRDSLKDLGKNLGPYLGVLGPLAGFVLAFIPKADSKELAYMKLQFKEVNNKLDIITKEFAEVKNAIDWSTVQVSYGTYERKIRAAEANLNKVFTADRLQDRRNNKEYFILTYQSDFDNSLQKLYDAIMENDHVFSKNIMEAVVEKTKNHKRKVEQFALGLVQLLIQGIKVKVAYYELKNWSSYQIRNEWKNKMDKLSTRLRRISNDVKRVYHKQLKTDAEDLILRYRGLDNRALMRIIYDFVVDKYNWRYWFVAVYNDVKGYDKHTMWLCGGYFLLHRQKKNVIIASQNKVYSSKFSRSKAAGLLNGVEDDLKRCRTKPSKHRARALVTNINDKVGKRCVPYALRMAVKRGAGLWYKSWKSHRAYKKIDMHQRCYCRPICGAVSWKYNVLLFG